MAGIHDSEGAPQLSVARVIGIISCSKESFANAVNLKANSRK